MKIGLHIDEHEMTFEQKVITIKRKIGCLLADLEYDETNYW